jgi:hypothetical protein
MSNMTPFEIRLDLLKMAQAMLEQDYYGKREAVSNDWHVKVENARHAGQLPPEHPGYPPYPSEQEIIQKASALNGFVSQIPAATVSEKSSKKNS